MTRSEPGTRGNQAAADFMANIQAKLGLLMRRKGVSRADLAASLKVGRPRITRLLGADSNMTVDTLARIFEALGEIPELRSDGIAGVLADLEARPPADGYPETRAAGDDWEAAPRMVFEALPELVVRTRGGGARSRASGRARPRSARIAA